jgi:hypothetical protein
MALVLLMEGINQFVIWRHLTENLDSLFDNIANLLSLDNFTAEQYFTAVSSTVNATLTSFWPTYNDTAIIDEIYHSLDIIDPNSGLNATAEEYVEAAHGITLELFKIVLEDYKFEPPTSVDGETFDDQINAYYAVFELVFCTLFSLQVSLSPLIFSDLTLPSGYFFITAGIVLISISVLSWLSMLKSQRVWRTYLGIGANFVLGAVLMLLTTMYFTDNIYTFGSSPWVLPLLVFILLICECT